MKKMMISVLLSGCLLCGVCVAAFAVESNETDKSISVLQKLSEEYGIELRFATKAEMDIIGFDCDNSGTKSAIDENTIRTAIILNEQYNQGAQNSISQGHWNIYQLEEGQTYINAGYDR